MKTGKASEPKIVRYRDDIDAGRAEARRQQLLDSLTVAPFDDQYEIANPQPWNRLSLRPRDVGSTYLAWPKLPHLAMLKPENGLMEKRGGALIDIDPSALQTRMQTYFDASIDWASFELLGYPLAKNAAGYKAKETRTKALTKGAFDDKNIVRYIVRPFDVRYAYFTDISSIWKQVTSPALDAVLRWEPVPYVSAIGRRGSRGASCVLHALPWRQRRATRTFLLPPFQEA